MQNIDNLYHAHEHLIDITINKNYNSQAFWNLHGLSLDEIRQFGRIGLFEACKTYDENRNTSFTTYAIKCIKWRIKDESKVNSLRSISKWTNETYDCDSLDTTLCKDENDQPINMYEKIECHEDGYFNINEQGQLDFLLDKIREKISNRVADIIELRLQDYGIVEIASVLNITHQCVSSVLDRHAERIKDIVEVYKL